jgi:hypothetical protein
VGKSTGDRARLFDSERFKRKFVTTLADLRCRRAGWASASSDTFSSRRAGLSPLALALGRRQPHPPRLLVAQGPRSGPAALPATWVLAAPQTGQSALGLAPRRIRFPRTSRPRRQNHGAVEEPQGWRASLALHFSNDAGSCRAANRTMRFRLGPAPNTVSENIQAAPSKPRRGGKAARLESEPCATLLQPLFNDSMTQ